MTQKILTFGVLLLFVYGIFNLDTTNLGSLSHNGFSYFSFIVFGIYFIYSLKKAAKAQDQNSNT